MICIMISIRLNETMFYPNFVGLFGDCTKKNTADQISLKLDVTTRFPKSSADMTFGISPPTATICLASI